MNRKSPPANVAYNVLMRRNAELYGIGKITIKTYKGDIYYVPFPSEKGTHVIRDSSVDRDVEHFSLHVSGDVFLKYKNGCPTHRPFYTNGGRQGVSTMGFQELFQDRIRHDVVLQKIEQSQELDVIFDIGEYVGSLIFSLSAISGQSIIDTARGVKNGVRAVSRKTGTLGSDRRCLGHHSGHGDILLQFILRQGIESFPTQRRIFFPSDTGIRKPNPTSTIPSVVCT